MSNHSIQIAPAQIAPAQIAFDIDGVVADTMSLFLSIAEEVYGISEYRYEDITEYDLEGALGFDRTLQWEIIVRILEGNYTMPLHPIGGAQRVLKRLNQRHRPTLFVTARPDADHIRDWLLDMLAVDPEAIRVVATGSFSDKKDVLLEHDIQYFVEDRLETCFLLAEAGMSPIVFQQPWNRRSHPFSEVGDWRQIESMIRLE
ncbi:MAG: 5' nucleotidase, NT5C type [Thermodesulfobacteriota bacterium]